MWLLVSDPYMTVDVYFYRGIPEIGFCEKAT